MADKKDPFSGIGSQGNAKNIADQTRAIRAYEQARKRLLASMKGEERALDSLASAQAAAAAARSRDALAYDRELSKARGALESQGTALKNLGLVRERYHREEMQRSESLLQRYETIKQTLLEIREDSDDTTTLLGSIVKPMKTGIDQMLRFGDIPKLSRGIREVGLSMDDLAGSTRTAIGAVGDVGNAMVEVAPTVWKYRSAVESLNLELVGLKAKYADATDGTEKLAYQFVNLSKTDIVAPGAEKTILKVTDSLKRLEAQGVNTESALSMVIDSSRTTGRVFEQSARDVEAVSAQADILKESLKGADTVLQGFSFTVRDDFVRAIADATRNLESQVVSIENVAAAYAYASGEVAKYGLSAKNAEKVASAFVQPFFQERQDAVGFLSGQRLEATIQRALSDAERRLKVQYSGAGEADQKALEEAVAKAIGLEATDENRLALKQGIGVLGTGLGPQYLRNLLAGTTSAIESDLAAIQKDIGVKNITDPTVVAELLAGIQGFEGLSATQKLSASRLLMEKGPREAAEEIRKLQQEATERADTADRLQSDALTAVLTFKDPIQQLFNIKDYLKSMMLNVSNITKLLQNILPESITGGILGLYNDTTDAVLGREFRDSKIAESLGTAMDERVKLQQKLTEAQAGLPLIDDAHMRERREAEIRNLTSQIEENDTSIAAIRELIGERERAVPGSVTESSFAGIPFKLLESQEQLRAEFAAPLQAAQSTALEWAAAARSAFDWVRGGEQQATPQQQATTGASTPSPRARAGNMKAVGAGRVSVNASGQSVMTVEMVIDNMGEVVAHHNTVEAKVLDQYGLSG